MKFIIDKVSTLPAHALSISEIKALLRAIPADWVRYVQTVHLKATLPKHSLFDRPVIYSSYSNRLNICSRGLSPQEARREILREIAARKFVPSRTYNRLSKEELVQVDRIIAPYLSKFAGDDSLLVHRF